MSNLESVVELGEPGAGGTRHDVPLLFVEGRDLLPALLHHLQRVHIPGGLLSRKLHVSEVATPDDSLHIKVSDIYPGEVESRSVFETESPSC